MLIVLLTAALILTIALYQSWPISYREQLQRLQVPLDTDIITFFHPFCDSGGGGERVLWMGIQALQKEFPNKIIAIYVWAGADLEAIPTKVKQQFDVDLHRDKLLFMPLQTWKYLEARRYPRLTLILSSLGSLITGWEAVQILRPKLFIESVGFAFMYPLFRLFGARVIAYVHYPTISSDMIKQVHSRTTSYNNGSMVAKSSILSYLKLHYYRTFSVMYGIAGRSCDFIMVNSSWTAGHINEIWRLPSKTSILFPPCDVQKLSSFPFQDRKRIILSVAQFRPEKDHRLQIEVLRDLFKRYPHYRHGAKAVKLVLLGSVRNDEDKTRVEQLKQDIERAGINVSEKLTF